MAHKINFYCQVISFNKENLFDNIGSNNKRKETRMSNQNCLSDFSNIKLTEMHYLARISNI